MADFSSSLSKKYLPFHENVTLFHVRPQTPVFVAINRFWGVLVFEFF